MIFAPTRASKYLCLNRIKEFRTAGYLIRADVGAEIIRPQSSTKYNQAVQKKTLSGQPLFLPLYDEMKNE